MKMFMNNHIKSLIEYNIKDGIIKPSFLFVIYEKIKD